MKQVILSLLLLSLSSGMHAQSLIDEDIQRIASGALAEEISHCPADAIRYAGVVVQQISSGNIVANVSLSYKDGQFINDPSANAEPFPTGLGRSALYLAMMPEADPYMVVDTKNGVYVDSDGVSIEDHNKRRGGYGLLDLKRAYTRNSDIGMLLCAQKVFNKDMKKYAWAINRTGALFGARVSEDYDGLWRSRDILGYTSPMSLLQMVCWCNAVAGGQFVIRMDEHDPKEPYDEIENLVGVDSLRSAMRETVTEGLGIRMRSEFVSVAAMTNATPKDAAGYKGLFAACYFPVEKPETGYTVGVYIMKSSETGYANPSNVARKIVDWIACNKLKEPPYLSMEGSPTIRHKEGYVHPAER